MIFRKGYFAVLPLLVFLAVASIPSCSAVTIGNVSSWGASGQDVTFDIQDGSKLRMSILTDDMIRFRFAPNGVFTPNISQAVVNTSWPAVSFTTQDMGSYIRITTGTMRIEVYKSPCVVRIRDLSGNLILGQDPNRRIQWDSNYTRVHMSTQSGETYLGLGWRPVDTMTRNGKRFFMRHKPSYENPDEFYGGIPLWYGVRNGDAYGMFFDDTSWAQINTGQASSQYMFFQNIGGQLDYYFFRGPAISDILDRYTELTGRPFMPPKWAAGYQQCRWSYYPQSNVLEIANEFRARNIPCDVIYHDIDYMDRAHQLTFCPTAFPDPAGMNATLHSQGFHTIANISPWLLENSSMWHEASNLDHLLKKANGTVHSGWHDYVYFVMNAPTGWVSWIDFSKTAAREWYKAKHTPFLNLGIDGIWNDLNEPQEFGHWPEDVKFSFDGQNVNYNRTSPQYCLLQSDFSYDVLADHYPNKRPFVLSRGAYAGIQRSAAVWSGDNDSDWVNDFRRNIPMGLAMSLSGQPHNGHDIGGFYGRPNFSDPIPPELFARWMQAGVFSAFSRGHHHGGGSRQENAWAEPWVHGPEVENISRDYISLRYRLMPYLYTLFHDAHTTGAPVHRPTIYDFQSDTATVSQDFDFMFGPYMLIAPVYTQGATTRAVYLPSGTMWTDWWTGNRYAGGQTVTVPAPLDTMPIFVRDGAIIPMGPVMQYANEFPLTELALKLYPSAQTSSFTMFEDDGVSWDYQSGGYGLTTYTMNLLNGSFNLNIAARTGGYVPAPRTYTAKIHDWTNGDAMVRLNGISLTRYYAKNQLMAAAFGYYHDAVARILYARFPDSGNQMTLVAEDSEPVPPTPIASAKELQDGEEVVITGTVSAIFPIGGASSRIYVQSEDRSSGIGINTSITVDLGHEMQAYGTMATSDGERVLNAANVWVIQTGQPAPQPLSMVNIALGGGSSGLQSAVIDNSAANQYSTKVSNIGLLTRTWGTVTYVDPAGHFFYINDGSGILDGSGHVGVRVACSGLPVPTADAHVTITGISGATLINGSLARLLKPRTTDDLSYPFLFEYNLINPGFETSLSDGWTVYDGLDGRISGTWFGDITAYSGEWFIGNAANGGTKSGGVYQRIEVPAGYSYQAEAWSRVFHLDNPADSVQNRVGIDPTGGTNPASQSILWSPVDIPTAPGSSSWRQLVSPAAVSEGGYVTIFLDMRQYNPNGWHINAFDEAEIVNN